MWDNVISSPGHNIHDMRLVTENPTQKTDMGGEETVSKYLAELEKFGFIIRNGNRYVLTDPMLKKGVELLTPGK